MSVHKTLYRQLLLAVRRMGREGIPCTGCVGLPHASHTLCPTSFLADAFRTSSNLNDAFHAVRMLPRQLSVLQASEEHTRQALQQWHSLQHQWCNQAPISNSQQIQAAEAAAWLLQRLVTQQQEQQLLLEEDVEELQQQCEELIAAAKQQLNKLAEAVQGAAPDAFNNKAQTGVPNSQRMLQLQTLSQVLFQQQGRRLRCDPFEWVYDGLAPLLLPKVLQTRKGMPLSLAMIAAAVGRRCGMELELVCADSTQMPGTASGPLLLQQLPPEVAARQAGRTLATAPPPSSWLLHLLPAAGQVWAQHDTVFLDVSQRGKLLDAATCQKRYPAMEGWLKQQAVQQSQPLESMQLQLQRHQLSRSSSGAAVLSLWSNLARTMVLAHQRRGESDLVAHWLYQLLALDSCAEEWGHAMQQ